nr:MAG TPA: hypothetical protein [Caudoviricetes sp.]
MYLTFCCHQYIIEIALRGFNLFQYIIEATNIICCRQ